MQSRIGIKHVRTHDQAIKTTRKLLPSGLIACRHNEFPSVSLGPSRVRSNSFRKQFVICLRASSITRAYVPPAIRRHIVVRFS